MRDGTPMDRIAARRANSAANEEHELVAVVAEERLADDRSDADATEHGDGEVAGRLGATAGRREIGDEGRCCDEQGGLADARDPAQRQQRTEGSDVPGEHARRAGHESTGDHHRPPAVAVDELTEEPSGQHRCTGERGDVETDAELAVSELVLDVLRYEWHEDAHVREEHERRQRHRHERPGDERWARPSRRCHRVHCCVHNQLAWYRIPGQGNFVTEITKWRSPSRRSGQATRATSTFTSSVCTAEGPMTTPRTGVTSP